MNISKDLISFISGCVSPFHVIAAAKSMLDAGGFIQLSETDPWHLSPGKSYYVVRNSSSIIAFRYPKADYRGFLISASHSDSPVFKLKENFQTGKLGAYICLNVEKYGGMLCAPWFDRPLSVAGRVMTEENGRIVQHLVNIDRDIAIIPSLAIHMNRTANDGAVYNAQTDMQPLLGSEIAKDRLTALIAENCGVEKDCITGTDLFLYCRQAGTTAGIENEYVCAPRLDDLMCAYLTLRALIESGNGELISMCCIFDNEEVGSGTKQGADSSFLSDTLERINLSAGRSEEQLYTSLASSFMVSADNAQAIHPNHPEKYDMENSCYMNRGVVIKFNAAQKYTTDAMSAAVFKAVCRKSGVPFQTYLNRADIPGGSTLGNISNSHVSVNTVDIGLAQLAMHSCYETAGAKDAGYLLSAMKTFFAMDYRCSGGEYSIG